MILVERAKKRLCYSVTAGSNPEKNITAWKEDITNEIIGGFIAVAENPSEEQKEFYKNLLQLAQTKVVKNEYTVPARLLDFKTHPISKQEITCAIKQALANQNVQTTEAEIEIMVSETAERLSGQKALVELLEHYRPPNKDEVRNIQFAPLDGQGRRMFQTSYELLVEMDRDVINIQEKIDELKAQRKREIAVIREKYGIVKEKLAENAEKVKEIKGEVHTIRKLIDDIKRFFGTFREHQVIVEEMRAEDFFDAHFNLPKIIENKVAASATMTFMPPEFYDVLLDMEQQRQQLHGLDEATEVRAKNALDGAGIIVRREAEEVQSRDYVRKGLISEHTLEEQQGAKVERVVDKKQSVLESPAEDGFEHELDKPRVMDVQVSSLEKAIGMQESIGNTRHLKTQLKNIAEPKDDEHPQHDQSITIE